MYLDRSTQPLMRLYAVCASVALFLILPAAIGQFGTFRIGPLALPFKPSAGGTLRVQQRARTLTIDKVSIDGAPPIVAGSVTFLRQSQALPAGTTIVYFGHDRAGNPILIRGIVRRGAATFARSLQQFVAILIASVFAIFGLGIAIAAADERASLGAAAMSGVALLFGPLFVDATIVSLASHSARELLLVVWQAFPRPLGLYLLPAFVASFPRTLPRNHRTLRFLLGATLVCAVASTILNVTLQLPGVAERLSLANQRLAIIAAVGVQSIGFALFLSATLAAIAAQLLARAAYVRSEKRRAAIVADAIAAGVALPMLLGIAQIVSLGVTARPIVPSPVMVASFLTLLLIPPAVAYATRARRVDSIRILVHRAALFVFARRTIQALSFVPLVLLAIVLYRHRTQPLVHLLHLHPFLIGTTIVAAALSLRFASAIERRLEAMFFRDRLDAHHILRRVAEATPRIDRLDDLSQMLETEIDRALHLESVSLFVRDPAGERFRRRGVPWFLESTSSVVNEMARTEDLYEVDDASHFNGADEIEQLWLSEASVRMLAPLRGGTGTLIGFLALGDKRSELPFDREDRMLLTNIAVAAALAIDNHVLRSSPPVGQRGSDAGLDDELPAAHYCPSCRAVFESSETRCPTDRATLLDAGIPAVIGGKYRLDAYLGAGGMGVVFRARDLTLGRAVAIKTLPRVSTAATARFRREARFGAVLTHSALAAVFSAETWRGRPLLILEYLARGTLAERIASGPISITTILDCGIRVSEALAALHDAGVLHRDVKPSNIGFATTDEPKLLDFGLARLVAESTVVGPETTTISPSDQPSNTSGLAGTPAYLPPEVIVGRRYDPSVDLWGLSMSMYEAVTGRHPFRDDSPLRMMNRIVSEDVPDPRESRSDCPEAIALLLCSALARDSDRRPPNGHVLARAWREAGRTVEAVIP